MARRGSRAIVRSAAIMLAVVSGGIAGFAVSTPAQGQGYCDTDVCSLDTGNCFNTIHQFRCKEIAGSPGCEDQECPES